MAECAAPNPALSDVRTVPRKEIDKSFVWEKYGGSGTAIDLMTLVNSTLLFNLSYGLYETNFPNVSRSRLAHYLKLRRLPNTEGAELVNDKKSCFSNIEAAVSVRSLGKDSWKKKTYNIVGIVNLVKEDDPNARKRDSLMSLKVTCPCVRSTFERTCRPSLLQRAIYRDGRKGNDVPGPFIDTVLCKHSCVSLDWASTFHNAASFEFFGINGYRAVNAANRVVEYVLKKNLDIANHPDYKVNEMIDRTEVNGYTSYMSYWSEPLRKYIFNRMR